MGNLHIRSCAVSQDCKLRLWIILKLMKVYVIIDIELVQFYPVIICNKKALQ